MKSVNVSRRQGVLAVTTGELSVRLWSLDTGENFVLSGQGGQTGGSEFISSLAWSVLKENLNYQLTFTKPE